MRATVRWTRVTLVLLCALTLLAVPAEAKKGDAYQVGFDEWLAAEGDFAAWQTDGVALGQNGELVLDVVNAEWQTDPYEPGAYYGGNFYNGDSYWVGEATSPIMPSGFDLEELIASWNAVTPEHTWVEVQVSAEVGGRWTKWYNLGIWASGTQTIERHSVRLQGDADAYVAVDTLVTTKKTVVSAYQLKVRLFSENLVDAPTVGYISAAYSTTPPKKAEPSAGNPDNWDILLDVPECSQMDYVGGNVWCSPTTTAMIVAYWDQDIVSCELMPQAALDIYDWVYDGTGNWPFNTAYAATFGLQGSVRRFASMEDVEYWVARGVPVGISYAWGKGELTGAAVSSSSGHLSVIVGFDADGNPIVNDPAANRNEGEQVRRTYLRSELEPLWLESSGGTVYVIVGDVP